MQSLVFFCIVVLSSFKFSFFHISLTLSLKIQNPRHGERQQWKWVVPRLSRLSYNRRCCVHVCLETNVWGRVCIAGPRAPPLRSAPGKWPLALLALLALRSIIPYVLNGEANANDWWVDRKGVHKVREGGRVGWGAAEEKKVGLERRNKNRGGGETSWGKVTKKITKGEEERCDIGKLELPPLSFMLFLKVSSYIMYAVKT